ncbi:MAG: DUF899 family protein [Pseudonocardia sp.]|jgi:predicted dithiol-disulfide oxidoreductase (DUF899 family)|nr:DUF899 family protein [Pseudonocardia sp.]OJY54366.1 MAG: hypothetical protein BGP03_13760 [Pseudonocardia sp. 73-21]
MTEPRIDDRATWPAERDALLVREKAHTRAGGGIAAARRRLPMVEIDPAAAVVGPPGRGLEAMAPRHGLIARTDGRPTAQWSRLASGVGA